MGTICNFWKVLRVPSGDICISRVSFERQVTPKAVRSCSVHTHDWPWAKRKASPVPWPESRGRRGRAGTAAGCGVAHSRRSGARQTPAPSTLPTTLSGGKTYLPLLRTRTRHDPPSSPSRNRQRWDTNPGGLVLEPALTTAPRRRSASQSARQDGGNLLGRPPRGAPAVRVWHPRAQRGPAPPPAQRQGPQQPPDRGRPTSGFSWLGGRSSFLLVA